MLIWGVLSVRAGFGADPGRREAIEVRGYLEGRVTWTDADGTPWTTTERLRPTAEWTIKPDRLSLWTTVEARLDQGRYPTGEVLERLRGPIEGSLEDLSGEGPSLEAVIDDCDWPIETTRTIDEIGDVLSVERLVLDVQLPAVDLRLGRQSVNWGSALFFNPTDLFFQILLTEPWQERAGVDALRANVSLREDVWITAIVATFDRFQRIEPGVRGTWHVGSADISGVFSRNDGAWFGGVDVKGDLQGPVPLGWWLEGGYDNNLRVAAGADYSFALLRQLYIAAQVYHDGSGQIPTFYAWETRQDPALMAIEPCPTYPELELPATATETRLTLGRWYGLAVARWQLTDDLTISSTAVINLADQTGLVFPTATVLVGGRLTLNGGAQVFFGEDGEFQPPPGPLQPVRGADLSPLVPRLTGLLWARLSL